MNSAKQLQGKGFKDSVGIEDFRGKYRINFSRKISRQYFGKDQQRMSTGLTACPENLAVVEAKCQQIHLDVVTGHFDVTLEKYGLGKLLSLSIVQQATVKEATLLELWDKWCEYKRSSVAPTTYQESHRGTYLRALTKAVASGATDALDIREWILKNYNISTAIEILSNLDRCYQLAVKHGLVTTNPYLDMSKDIKRSKAVKTSSNDDDNGDIWEDDEFKDIRAFTVEERDAIIQAFQETKSIQHWTPYVKFLFYTGCRPGEASALRWSHVSADCSILKISKSYSSRHKITKSTKTGETRIFRCDERLKDLLLSIKPEDAQSDTLVFTSKTGKQVDSKLLGRIWRGSGLYRGLLPRLLEEGKIKKYLKPYATRHTFITLQIHSGISANVVATWVGNSADVIWKHYCDHEREVTPKII